MLRITHHFTVWDISVTSHGKIPEINKEIYVNELCFYKSGQIDYTTTAVNSSCWPCCGMYSRKRKTIHKICLINWTISAYKSITCRFCPRKKCHETANNVIFCWMSNQSILYSINTARIEQSLWCGATHIWGERFLLGPVSISEKTSFH